MFSLCRGQARVRLLGGVVFDLSEAEEAPSRRKPSCRMGGGICMIHRLVRSQHRDREKEREKGRMFVRMATRWYSPDTEALRRRHLAHSCQRNVERISRSSTTRRLAASAPRGSSATQKAQMGRLEKNMHAKRLGHSDVECIGLFFLLHLSSSRVANTAVAAAGGTH